MPTLCALLSQSSSTWLTECLVNVSAAAELKENRPSLLIVSVGVVERLTTFSYTSQGMACSFSHTEYRSSRSILSTHILDAWRCTQRDTSTMSQKQSERWKAWTGGSRMPVCLQRTTMTAAPPNVRKGEATGGHRYQGAHADVRC